MENNLKRGRKYVLTRFVVVCLIVSIISSAAGSLQQRRGEEDEFEHSTQYYPLTQHSLATLNTQKNRVFWNNEAVSYSGTQQIYQETDHYINISQYLNMQRTSLEGFIDEDQDNIDDRLEDILLNSYAPVVILNSQEDCWPCNVDWFLSRSHMRFHHSGCSDCGIIDHGYPNQANIITQEHRKKQGWPICSHYNNWEHSWFDFDEDHCFFLQLYNPSHSGIKPSDFDGFGSEHWIVYGHVYPNNFGGVNLQYWFFFAYNDGYSLGNHEGDWEHILVELYNDFSVRSVVFYQHEGSQTMYNLNHMQWYKGSHPVVLCALGSHASYPTSTDCDNHPNSPFPERSCNWCTVPVDDCPDSWYTWQSGKPAHALGYQGGGIINVGEKLSDRQGHLNDQSFIHYSGRWGEIGNFDFTSGPRGPAYQQSWYHNAGPLPTTPHTYLALDKFPFYGAEQIPEHGLNQMSGAATAQMILSYLFWNSDSNPEGPLPYCDQHTLFHRFHPLETGYITVDEMAAGLNREIDDPNQNPPYSYGYFFTPYRDPDQDQVLQQICLWLYYPIDFYNDLRLVDVPKPGHPNHAPVAAPILGTEAWWVAIKGIYSDCDPWESYPDFPSSITIYGLWVNDPYPFDTVVPAYVTSAEWKSTWFLSINGQYHAVVDPPADIDERTLPKYDTFKLEYATPTPRFSSNHDNIVSLIQILGDTTPTVLKTLNEQIIIQAATEEVSDVLHFCNHELTNVFLYCQSGTTLYVTNEKNGQHYYIVVFRGKETGFVVRISASTGELRDFSISSEKTIQAYLHTYENTQHLIYSEGSPYYPTIQK